MDLQGRSRTFPRASKSVLAHSKGVPGRLPPSRRLGLQALAKGLVAGVQGCPWGLARPSKDFQALSKGSEGLPRPPTGFQRRSEHIAKVSQAVARISDPPPRAADALRCPPRSPQFPRRVWPTCTGIGEFPTCRRFMHSGPGAGSGRHRLQLGGDVRQQWCQSFGGAMQHSGRQALVMLRLPPGGPR